jgi:anti-sigma factor RsiW
MVRKGEDRLNHCEYQGLLSQYIDEQLDAQTAYSLEHHLPLCPQCRRELEQLAVLRQMCMELPEEDIPAGLHERIIAEARSTDTKKGLGWVRRAVIPLAAAVLIFLLSRGLPGLPNDRSSTTQDSGGIENMLMAAPKEKPQTADDLTAQDAKSANRAEAPMTVEEAEPDSEAAQDLAGEAGAADNRRAASEKAAVERKVPDESVGIMEAKAGFDGQFERPSYLKYGIIIALITALGLTMIRLMKRKK